MTVFHNRHECKFVVPESVAARVLRRVAPFVRPDPHAERRPDHSYTIASLYLDDRDRSLYRETIEGQAHRFKLRVRSYTDAADLPVFLEVKRRCDRVVQKLRCPVPRPALPALLDGSATSAPGLPPAQLPALHEFLRLLQLRRAEPQLLVRYQRQAYVGVDDDAVRVTVDRHLCAVAAAAPAVRVHDPRYTTVPTHGVILELKFTDRCPPWMLDAVRENELRRRSCSKYCLAVDALTELGLGQAL